jgi:hypothetical protein
MALTLVGKQSVPCHIRTWNCYLFLFLLYSSNLAGYKAILKRKGNEVESKLTSPLIQIHLLLLRFSFTIQRNQSLAPTRFPTYTFIFPVSAVSATAEARIALQATWFDAP